MGESAHAIQTGPAYRRLRGQSSDREYWLRQWEHLDSRGRIVRMEIRDPGEKQ
jgi:hypothetical protein